jgi:hypothetical protein
MVANTPIPQFLFYLVNELGLCYYIAANGELRTTGSLAPLEYSPDGWEDMSIGWERNLQKFGLVRNFSMTLSFPGDGGLILEKLFNRQNADFKVWLLVQRLELEVTDTDYALTHKLYYKGEIDLSTYRKVRRKILVNIMEGGRHKDIKANENTVFQVPLAEDPDRVRVLVEGIEFNMSARWVIPEVELINVRQYLIPMGLLSQDLLSRSLTAAFPQTFGTYFGGPTYNFSLSENFPFYTKRDVTVRIHGQVRVNMGSGGFLWIVGSSNTAAIPGGGTAGAVYYESAIVGAGLNTFDIDVTVDLPAGEELFFHMNKPFETTDNFLETNIQIDFKYKHPDSFIYVLKGSTLFKRLTGKISDSEDYAVSSLLDGSSLCYTSGDGMRGISGAFFKIMFKSFVDDVSVRKCAGLGVEGKNIVIEGRSYFLADDTIIELGEVKSEPEVSLATDIMFNSLKLGHNDPKIEDVNGRYAFNALYQYTVTGLKRVAKSLDLVCPFPSDPYYLEIIRINLEGKATVDAGSDNETLVVNVDLDNEFTDADGVYYKLKRAVYTSVTGIPNPDSVFNIEELTGARILEAWESYLRGALTGYEASKLQFENSTKNRELATVGGPGGDYDEDASKLVGTLAAPFFQNRKITVTALSTHSIYKVLTATPRACFSFTYQGSTFKGYLLKCSIKCKTGQEQEFVFISHIDNDLTLLENYG